MKWHIDEQGRLVITVSKKEQRSLRVAQRRDQSFDSDAFMHDLLEPLGGRQKSRWILLFPAFSQVCRCLECQGNRDLQRGKSLSTYFSAAHPEPLVTNDFTWLPEACTDDLTSAPMLGVLGDEMPGPDDTQDAIGMGLIHVGRWQHEGCLRQMYQPVLRRWAFMDYAITSPQRELAETGECTWDGGDFWATQDAVQKALAELIGCGD